MRCVLRVVGALVVVVGAITIAAASERPNIVVFISDDHGFLDSSVAGSADFATPNLQRLAGDGMTLTEAMAASPSCAPSRAAILTGLMPHRNGAMLNHQPPRDDVKKLPAYLRELGYEVVAFGKVAHYEQGKRYGFDAASHDKFHDDQCVTAAAKFLAERKSDRPLCLMVGTNWPHVPWSKATADKSTSTLVLSPTHVDTPETRSWRSRYVAAVENMDADLGAIRDAAYAHLGPNTVFLHFSDHGAQWPFGKWNLYDAGLRVPFFAVWPGKIEPGRQSSALVSLVDVLPTIIEVAGGAPPMEIDGRSFAGILLGKQDSHRAEVFGTHSGDGEMNQFPMRSVRTERWKYILNLRPESEHHTHIDRGKSVDGRGYWPSWAARAKSDPHAAAIVNRYFHRPAEELFDLDRDPNEQHNLAENPDMAGTLAELRAALDTWMGEQGDHGLASETAAAEALAAFEAERDAKKAPKRLNVLFITIDDLRPQLGCYGHPETFTPRLDELARQGRLFEHHYVQAPTCGASRCALLTGRYPRQSAAYDNNAFATLPRSRAAAALTLPGMFRRAGYRTESIGKITHSPDGRREDGEDELAYAWDQVGAPAGKWKDGWSAFFGYADGSTRTPGLTPATEHADVPDDGYPDGLIAEAAIARLRALKDKPFFLAVGFFKPHLPFNAPKRYWELYDEAAIKLAEYRDPPQNVDPSISLHKSAELTPRYTGLAQPGVVSDSEARHLRRAYYACVSYVDAQVGRVLDELDELGLSENTIVVVWGDHGWHLGEHGVWGKHTLHEVALRSPLLIRTPNIESPGAAAAGIVESIDILPTLADVCGLRIPPDLDGRSFAPLLNNPATAGKDAAYGFWAGGRAHSIRTNRHRLTEWRDDEERSRILQVELYDHQIDPAETKNIASEQHQLVRELTRQLHQTIPALQETASKKTAVAR